MVDALVIAMEAKGSMHGAYYVPDRHTLYAAQVLTQQLYPKVMTTLRSLAGGSMIMLPSGIEDLADPVLADYSLRVQGSATLEPEERDYLAVLIGLIEDYEEAHHPMAPVSGPRFACRSQPPKSTLNAITPWSMLYFAPKNTTSPCVTTTRPIIPG